MLPLCCVVISFNRVQVVIYCNRVQVCTIFVVNTILLVATLASYFPVSYTGQYEAQEHVGWEALYMRY
jgi:hypothetical protein